MDFADFTTVLRRKSVSSIMDGVLDGLSLGRMFVCTSGFFQSLCYCMTQLSINQGDPFLGCSAVPTGCLIPGHIFRQIPRDVDRGFLAQMFSTGRVNHSDAVIVNGPCTFTVPPRTGLKQKHCREPAAH